MKPKIGTLVWFELPADDVDRAKGFYGELFGWKFKQHMGSDYFMVDMPAEDKDEVGIGLYKRKEGKPEGEHAVAYFAVEEVDRSLERANRLGGSIKMRKTLISPDMGYFGQCYDTEGNLIAFWSEK